MIVIDFQKRMLFKDNKEIPLHSKLSFNLLVYLTESGGMVRTRQEIIDKCWDSRIVTSRSVDVLICTLRKVIDDPVMDGKHKIDPEVIIPVKEVGYKVNLENIKLINHDNTEAKSRQYDGYTFIKQAKYKGETVIILQSIKNVDEWLIVPKSEYQ